MSVWSPAQCEVHLCPAGNTTIGQEIKITDTQRHTRWLVRRALNAAQDATRKQVSMGDIVDISAGRVKGRSGTVKFIHRQGLFLHVR